MNNPIINNRIVNDPTFAVRLLHFLEKVEPQDFASEEELEYLTRVARKLLNYQKATANTAEECDYLRRLEL
jgi:hypothetical protein